MAAQVVVDFNAQITRFTSGIDKMTNDMNKFQSNANRISGNINKIFGTLGVGLSVTGLAYFIKGTIDALDKLGDLSKSTGIAVEQLAGLQLAAKQSGTDLEGVAASIAKLSVNIGKEAEKFEKLGITSKDPLEAFKQLADVFVSIKDPTMRAAMAAEALGKSWQSAAPLLSEGGKAIGEIVGKGTRLSGVTKEAQINADKLNDSWAALGTAGSGIVVKVLTPMIPALNEIANDMARATDKTFGFVDALKMMWKYSPTGQLAKMMNDIANPKPASGRSSSGKITVAGGDTERMKAVCEFGGNMWDGKKCIEKKKVVGGAKSKDYSKVDDYASRINAAVGQAISGSDVVKAREYADTIAALDKLFFDSALDAEIYASAMDKITGAQEGVNDAGKRLADMLDNTASAALERDRADMILLADAYERGQISYEKYVEAVQARLGFVGDAAESDIDIARDLGMSFSSAFEDAIVGGKGLSEVLKGLEQDIMRIMTRKLVTEPLANMGTKFIQNFDWSSLFGSANGNVITSPALSAYSNSIVSKPTLFPFANGIGLMGEAGAEAIMPLKRGSDGKLGVAGGGNMVVNMTISTPDANSFRASEGQIKVQAARMLQGARRNM